MAAHPEYWSPSLMRSVESARAYEELNFEPAYRDDYTPPVYTDVATGLVVTDLHAFERWIKKVEDRL